MRMSHKAHKLCRHCTHVLSMICTAHLHQLTLADSDTQYTNAYSLYTPQISFSTRC